MIGKNQRLSLGRRFRQRPSPEESATSRWLRLGIPRGFTLAELIGTCLLLGTLFSMTVPMLLVVARERRSTEQRQFAMQYAANMLEYGMNRNWTELESRELTVPDVDPVLQSVLPGLERTLTVVSLDGEPETRQVVASVRWTNRTGELTLPFRLCGWVHRKNEVP